MNNSPTKIKDTKENLATISSGLKGFDEFKNQIHYNSLMSTNS